MKIEKIVKSLKKDYEAVHPSNEIVRYGWNALLSEIKEEEHRKYFFRNSSFLQISKTVFISFALFLVIGYGLVEASSQALPGQLLYPLKHVAELIQTKVSVGIQPKIDNKEEKLNLHTATESSKKEFSEKQNSKNTDDKKNSKEVFKKEKEPEEKKPDEIKQTSESAKDIPDSVDSVGNKVKQDVQSVHNGNNVTDSKKETEDSLKKEIDSIIEGLQK